MWSSKPRAGNRDSHTQHRYFRMKMTHVTGCKAFTRTNTDGNNDAKLPNMQLGRSASWLQGIAPFARYFTNSRLNETRSLTWLSNTIFVSHETKDILCFFHTTFRI